MILFVTLLLVMVGSLKSEWLSRGLTTATQSSTPDATRPANNALDQEVNSDQSHSLTASEANAWWKVDLTEECIVTQIIFSPNPSLRSAFIGAEIRVGNSNGAFNTNPLFAIIDDDDPYLPKMYRGDVALKGRYVSIQLQQGGAALKLGFIDVRVFGYRTNQETCKLPLETDAIRLGMENGRISDEQITATSTWNDGTKPPRARLNLPSGSGHHGSWVAGITSQNKEQWIQVAFYKKTLITALITQGRHESDQWVTKYKVEYTEDGFTWKYILDGSAHKIFDGNTDRTTLITHQLQQPIWVMKIKFRPWTWKSYISFRFELVGCESGSCTGHPTPNYGASSLLNSHFHFPWPQIPDGVTRITFTHRGGPTSAYILLSNSKTISDSTAAPKIVIGGWNDQGLGYKCESTQDWQNRFDVVNTISDTEDRSFFVAFSDDTIEVGREGEEPLYIIQPNCMLVTKYFGIASRNDADWTFCGYDTETSHVCKGPIPIGWSVKTRANTDSATNLIMVSTDRPFLCDGVVTEWHYWGSTSQAFRAIILRRIFGKKTEYTTVGINNIPSGASGKEEVYVVPIEDQIHIQKGDVIGFAFETALLVWDSTESTKVRWTPIPSGLQQGTTVTFSSGGTRSYSISATVDSYRSSSVLTPKGLWPLNSKFEAKDLTGQKMYGISTTASYQDGVVTGNVNGFMNINGAGGSCVEIPNALDLYVSEFTMMMYFRRLNTGEAPFVWFDTHGTSSIFGTEGLHRTGLKVVTQSGTNNPNNGRYIPRGQWVWIAVTYKAADTVNPGIVSILLDGHLACSVENTAYDKLRTGSTIKIGSCDGKTVNGEIAWFQIYDKYLNEDDILKAQRIPKKGLAFAESVKVTNSGHAVGFRRVDKGCLQENNSSIILGTQSNIRLMKCAAECVALSDCVAWDLESITIVDVLLKTYKRTCRFMNRTPIKSEISENSNCAIYELHHLSTV